MDYNIEEILDGMNLYDLSELARKVFSSVYNRLQDEEGFSSNQHCSVLSIGPEEFDVRAVIIDDPDGRSQLDWPQTWRL